MLLGPGALALAQEDALVVGGDLGQGQCGPSVLQAEPVLVLPRFALALALPHAEDEDGLLLVDLRASGQDAEGGLQAGQTRPPTPSGAPALTENQSWLALPWEREAPHLRRAVAPTSTSSNSGSGR